MTSVCRTFVKNQQKGRRQRRLYIRLYINSVRVVFRTNQKLTQIIKKIIIVVQFITIGKNIELLYILHSIIPRA